MHFVPTVFPAEIPALLRRFLDIADWHLWEKRIATFSQWTSENEFLEDFIADRYPIEFEMGRFKAEIESTGEIPTTIETHERYNLIGFISTVSRVHQRLSEHAKKRISGIIRGGLKGTGCLSPLAGEMVVATHLMLRGYDVMFYDLEEGGGFDFLVTLDELEFEIECKHVTADIGRKIHQRKFFSLAGIICPYLTSAAERKAGGQLIRVTLPAELTSEQGKMEAVARFIADAVEQGVSVSESSLCAVKILQFPLENSPFTGNQVTGDIRVTVNNFLEQQYGIINKNVVTIFGANRSVVILVVESKTKDTVLQSVIDNLKNSSRDQLTGDRPGIMCVYLSDLDAEALRRLALERGPGPSGETGLMLGANVLLGQRSHVHTVAFMTQGPVIETVTQAQNIRSSSLQENGGVYPFTNSEHPLASDTRLELF